MDKDKDTTPHTAPTDDGRTIRWDDVTIGQEALHMPPDLREDYCWLKGFTRDTCTRDIDALVQRLKELGIHRDKTTWAKILRGRYQRDMRGATKAPVVSAQNFREEVEALRANVRVESMRGLVPFVETSTWEVVSDAINARRETSRVNKWLVVVGPTGAEDRLLPRIHPAEQPRHDQARRGPGEGHLRRVHPPARARLRAQRQEQLHRRAGQGLPGAASSSTTPRSCGRATATATSPPSPSSAASRTRRAAPSS